jgi:hypothetical protein
LSNSKIISLSLRKILLEEAFVVEAEAAMETTDLITPLEANGGLVEMDKSRKSVSVSDASNRQLTPRKSTRRRTTRSTTLYLDSDEAPDIAMNGDIDPDMCRSYHFASIHSFLQKVKMELPFSRCFDTQPTSP